ncbi:bacilysin biosynthesis oxidoreductase BacC [Clostridium pasteurianum DSM 525 = ATCC 6013]|uniref:3-oxoacyl-(Acyl-carrier-protein) reductase n=1 Tax=Clostridium pasteurianum DSM 525 = ATCC 6013 TaxID=1262449 RepID=A0A0H3J561_CLOPA|nr:SDR family oxidoreductase [Clostridium pasteurianum]AJA49076.1 bacilysin biosynthesis oxidoreductase BacC [Clostridium pasteurianum DSM 525 = ATCC 6013]AJA53064.1 bacilysin biosynthesis oxidoreductase BacC [Clostridium pasteurianum DSM 525 = ATCC 6013]AOZ76277.1 short-chain dehydrogenase [Clostridium pasteurianum DSM 525 = ATCC 6013]AOZ80073.1 short-chain dehydrogenase [Clostridium pasteurianum]ELP59013.1 short chain dehydrogenase [Clostridium pasteurianum DSM 525 = ATCC 6013]
MKRVLITGGTSGMGLSATKLFLEKGWKVMAVDINGDRGEKLIKELNKKGYNDVYFYKCNIAKDNDVKILYDYTMKTLNGIDSIINNAGIWTGGMLHETKEEDWNRIFDIDVKSIYLTSKYFVPYMIENGGGTIVNTASVSGMFGDYNMAAYNAAKGAVVNMAKAMALDYGKYNIRVNNVCPSACATPLFLSNPKKVVDLFNEANPLKRICTPEEVAKAMYFLASDDSSSCNGVNLPVSGGLDVHTGQPVQ